MYPFRCAPSNCDLIFKKSLFQEKDPLKLWGYGLFGALALVHPLACCWNNHELIDQVLI